MIALVLSVILAFSPSGPSSSGTGTVNIDAVHADTAPDRKHESQQRTPFFDEVRENVRCHIEQLEQDVALQVGREKIAFNALLSDFYQARGFNPVWNDPDQVTELVTAILESEADGLLPSDYHLGEIQGFYTDPPESPFLRARYDLLLSDALFKLSWHLFTGKVDPEKLDSNWNLKNGISGDGLVWRLQNALDGDSLSAVISDIRPSHPKYLSLKKALARYRTYAAEGGWPSVPQGPSLKEQGQYDERMPLLRKRLEITGDLEPLTVIDTSFASSAMLYSTQLVDAVIRFQRRHGLEPDGVVGPRTIQALNTSAEDRVRQIRINLERYRWFIQKLEPSFILVNIAGFTLQYVENGEFRWASRVIVGEPYWKTPVFTADMRYLIFNPSWNVPPGILRKEALPSMQAGGDYLVRNGLQVIDRSGNVVDPSGIDWNSYASGSFPYRLRQPPGERNALGRVKFMFPNPHHVYLHDTPGKHLFGKSVRAFSHGCIRLENPLEFASILTGWDPAQIDSVVASGRTRTVNLEKPIPVFLLYLTAVAEGDEVLFRNDVYRRDEQVFKALERSFPYKTIESCTF
jgi:L,D-transpeptidase YcbB